MEKENRFYFEDNGFKQNLNNKSVWIKKKEITEVLKALKNGKAKGESEISPEMYLWYMSSVNINPSMIILHNYKFRYNTRYI